MKGKEGRGRWLLEMLTLLLLGAAVPSAASAQQPPQQITGDHRLMLLENFLGDAALVPISELGALAIVVGWLMACLSFLRGVSWEASAPPRRARAVAALGALVACVMILMKLLPFVPGHMTWPETVCLAGWMLLGLALRPRKGSER